MRREVEASGSSDWRGFLATTASHSLSSASALLLRLAVPMLQGFSLLLAALVLSVVLSYFTYVSLLPRALLHEPIYFDFSATPPVARVNLLSEEKQWYYLKSDLSHAAKESAGDDEVSYSDRRFLKTAALYHVEVDFKLAKSARNYDTGKFMLSTILIDTSGDAIAKSIRPVAIPYQSDVHRLLSAVALFPLRLVGLIDSGENSLVTVPVMNRFKEPASGAPATELIEVKMSTPHVDVAGATLTVMPLLGGLSYYVYYYPRLFLATSTLALTTLQVGAAFLIVFISWVVRYTSRMLSAEDGAGDDDDDNEDSSFGYAYTARRRSGRPYGRTLESPPESDGSLLSGADTPFNSPDSPTPGVLSPSNRSNASTTSYGVRSGAADGSPEDDEDFDQSIWSDSSTLRKRFVR